MHKKLSYKIIYGQFRKENHAYRDVHCKDLSSLEQGNTEINSEMTDILFPQPNIVFSPKQQFKLNGAGDGEEKT